jgi:cytochrome c
MRPAIAVLLACASACSMPARDTGSPTRPVSETTLGIGRTATPGEIAALDIDVRPDGTGLPIGSGTASVGSAIYAARCAACHGTGGEGTPAGMTLVGRLPNDAFNFGAQRSLENRKTVGSYWPYATTLYDYINRAMPPDRPGSLLPDEIYALSAWLLWKNAIIGEHDRMDRTTLPAVHMPARARFVPDDRLQYRRVR